MKRIEMVAQARNMMNEVLMTLEPDKNRILHTPITAYALLLAERALNFRENIIERMAANPDMTEKRAMEEFMPYYEAARRIKKVDEKMEEENDTEEAEKVSHYCERCLAILDRLTDLNGLAMPGFLSLKLGIEFEGFSDVQNRIEEIRRYADAVQDFAEEGTDTPKDLEKNGREVREMYRNLYATLVMTSPRCGKCDRFAVE